MAASRFAASAVFEPAAAADRRAPLRDRTARTLRRDARLDAATRASAGASTADHRAELGLPATGRHSFADGLDRLFLGYALPAHVGDAARTGACAAGNAEGSAALALGSLRDSSAGSQRLHADLAQPQSPDDVAADAALGVIDDFVAPAGDEIDDERETAAAHPRAPRQHDCTAASSEPLPRRRRAHRAERAARRPGARRHARRRRHLRGDGAACATCPTASSARSA